MPAAKRRTARVSAQGQLNRLRAGLGLSGNAQVVDLPTFIEGEGWGGMSLRPRQRTIMRVTQAAMDQVPVSERLQKVQLFPTSSMPLETLAAFAAQNPHCCPSDGSAVANGITYDEAADWAQMLKSEDPYCRAWSTLDPNSDEPVTIVLIMGRGSSKTTYFSAGTAAYATYKLLNHKDPHAYYGLTNLKPLRVQNVATSSTQAGEFFDAYRSIVERVEWFEGRYQPPQATFIKFGRKLYAEKTSSNSKSGRGRDTVFYGHDEIAFAEQTGGPRSDQKLYDSLRAAVKSRAHGKGVVYIVSSPMEAQGVLYQLHTQISQGQLENAVLLQVSTWNMIPGQTKETYAAEYANDAEMADMEYGAQFASGTSLLLPSVRDAFPAMEERFAKLMALEGADLTGPMPVGPVEGHGVDERFRKFHRRWLRVIHVDTSAGGDRTALVMASLRGRTIVVEMARAWDRTVLFTQELVPFIAGLCRRYDVDQVSFDQFQSVQAQQDLENMGIKAVVWPFSIQTNNLMARNIQQVVGEGALAMPALTDPAFDGHRATSVSGWEDDEELWPQASLYHLREEMAVAIKRLKRHNGKAVIAGEAPTTGMTTNDDLLDCLMAACYQIVELAGGLSAVLLQPANAEQAKADKHGKVDQEFTIHCQHHHGYVKVVTSERFAPCPVCRQTIQVRL